MEALRRGRGWELDEDRCTTRLTPRSRSVAWHAAGGAGVGPGRIWGNTLVDPGAAPPPDACTQLQQTCSRSPAKCPGPRTDAWARQRTRRRGTATARGNARGVPPEGCESSRHDGDRGSAGGGPSGAASPDPKSAMRLRLGARAGPNPTTPCEDAASTRALAWARLAGLRKGISARGGFVRKLSPTEIGRGTMRNSAAGSLKPFRWSWADRVTEFGRSSFVDSLLRSSLQRAEFRTPPLTMSGCPLSGAQRKPFKWHTRADPRADALARAVAHPHRGSHRSRRVTEAAPRIATERASARKRVNAPRAVGAVEGQVPPGPPRRPPHPQCAFTPCPAW